MCRDWRSRVEVIVVRIEVGCKAREMSGDVEVCNNMLRASAVEVMRLRRPMK